MKEILAKIFRFIGRLFCLFKLTVSCELGLRDKDEQDEESGKEIDAGSSGKEEL